MARRHFKPDASFFRKIAIGAMGANEVRKHLNQHGYDIVELERGATETKIWKDVKRKRVRIPDLVCKKSGTRIEVRAKTSPSLQMSHSPDEAERAWDYGLTPTDWLAFPVCQSIDNEDWSDGGFEKTVSYFHQRLWEQFELRGKINYFTVEKFRDVRHASANRKGVVEASEYSIIWDAKFSTRTGPVRYVCRDEESGNVRVCIENESGKAYTWRVDDKLEVLVERGDIVVENQVFAAAIQPIAPEKNKPKDLDSNMLKERFLDSKERTMRFTGVKLARLRDDNAHVSVVRELAKDCEEDLYVRLEALSYLAAVAGDSVAEKFGPYLDSGVDEDALEAVICIGEVANAEAIQTLDALLQDSDRPYYLRSASAWALSHIQDESAQEALIRAFDDQTLAIKEEVLRGLVSLGKDAVPKLIHGLKSDKQDVAAGCAEALRRYRTLSGADINAILKELSSNAKPNWSVWLIGSLPKCMTANKIAAMQDVDEQVHYGLSLLWSFSQSWISKHWDKYPHPNQESFAQ